MNFQDQNVNGGKNPRQRGPEIIKIEVKSKVRGISWDYRRFLSVKRASVPSGSFEIPGPLAEAKFHPLSVPNEHRELT
jgi:hypothetical protein